MRKSWFAFAALLFLVASAPRAAAQPSFVNFESGHVRPLALSPDGTTLFAVNTPDNHLEVFDVDASGITHRTSVAVGLEPVAVAPRGNDEVWVVNHLSDSVSIVDLTSTPPRVVRTLLVGDEPRDIVFSGNGRQSGVHHDRTPRSAPNGSDDLLGFRGDRLGRPAADDAEGIGRADVWVFDADESGFCLSAAYPLSVVKSFFGDTPRALAVSNDGNTVYVSRSSTTGQPVPTTVNAKERSATGSTRAGALRRRRRHLPRTASPGGNLPGGNPGPSTRTTS